MGELLGYDDYPGLDPMALGSPANMGYGTLQGLKCPALQAGLAFALGLAVAVDDNTITVTDASRMGTLPMTLQVGAEQMSVTGVSGNVLTVTRGLNSTKASLHPAGRRCYEVLAQYVYMIADHPVGQVDAVYVDGGVLHEGYTVYTGQAGDELTGYEGQAVLAMDAAAYVGRQYMMDAYMAELRLTGMQQTSTPLAWSSRKLVDGMDATSELVGGAGGSPVSWVSFDHPGGRVIEQSYSAMVENVTDKEVRVNLIVSREGVCLMMRTFTLAPLDSTTMQLSRAAGDEDDEFAVVAVVGQINVSAMNKSVRLDTTLEPERIAELEMIPSGTRGSRILRASGVRSMYAEYAAIGAGSVRMQQHRISMKETGGISSARVRLVSQDGYMREARVSPGETETVTLEHEGGLLGSSSTILALEGEVEVTGISKSVQYYPTESGRASDLVTESSAAVVVGRDVRVDVQMAVDLDGSYGGAGTLIQRPDHVMRHFLVEHAGYETADIDTISFDAAGSAYAAEISGGYRLALLLDDARPASYIIGEMARQSRSFINYSDGKWRLDYIPDVAPAAVKVIAAGELAGQGAMFEFARTPLSELGNRIFMSYAPSLDSTGRWLGHDMVEDTESQAGYGMYERTEILGYVRHEGTAQSVLGHMLLESATPLVRVKFSVFYEHFDLTVGDTIEIDNELYGGKKFFIESIDRIDQLRAEISAIEWWG